MWFSSKKNRKLSLDGGIFSRLPYAHALSYRMRFALSHSSGDLDNSFILIRVFCFPFWRVISYLSLTAGNNEIFRNGSPSTPVMDDDTLFELGNLQVRPKSRGGMSLSCTSTFLGRLGPWLLVIRLWRGGHGNWCQRWIDNSFILFPFWCVIFYLSLTMGNNEIFCNGSPSTPSSHGRWRPLWIGKSPGQTMLEGGVRVWVSEDGIAPKTGMLGAIDAIDAVNGTSLFLCKIKSWSKAFPTTLMPALIIILKT